ncbi:MAG: flagellar biosynthesis protein FlhB [Alphaproteobacteria bacterium]|jgi:flagellar biosynthetic protein FlhB
MAEDHDKAQKTEEPTPKRIEEAIRKGNVAFSKELSNFILLTLFSVFVILLAPSLFQQAAKELAPYLTEPDQFGFDYDGDDVFRLAIKIILDVFLILMIPFLISIFGSILSAFLQNGFLVAPEAIMPKLSKISPISGFNRIFSKDALVNFFKGIVKILIIAITSYIAIYTELGIVDSLHEFTHIGILVILGKIIAKLLISICSIMAIIAAADLLYEKYKYRQNLMMTREEVKEEMKQMEGNPEIKAKIKSVRAQRARRRIAATVPKADVIITNPTHFSVALEYNADEMPAPKLIAKGQDRIALRIREIAAENNIPIIENKPLARSLFDTVDEDEFIAVEHYEAVAAIMSKIKKFTNKRKKPA